MLSTGQVHGRSRLDGQRRLDAVGITELVALAGVSGLWRVAGLRQPGLETLDEIAALAKDPKACLPVGAGAEGVNVQFFAARRELAEMRQVVQPSDSPLQPRVDGLHASGHRLYSPVDLLEIIGPGQFGQFGALASKIRASGEHDDSQKYRDTHGSGDLADLLHVALHRGALGVQEVERQRLALVGNCQANRRREGGCVAAGRQAQGRAGLEQLATQAQAVGQLLDQASFNARAAGDQHRAYLAASSGRGVAVQAARDLLHDGVERLGRRLRAATPGQHVDNGRPAVRKSRRARAFQHADLGLVGCDVHHCRGFVALAMDTGVDALHGGVRSEAQASQPDAGRLRDPPVVFDDIGVHCARQRADRGRFGGARRRRRGPGRVEAAGYGEINDGLFGREWQVLFRLEPDHQGRLLRRGARRKGDHFERGPFSRDAHQHSAPRQVHLLDGPPDEAADGLGVVQVQIPGHGRTVQPLDADGFSCTAGLYDAQVRAVEIDRDKLAAVPSGQPL